MSSTKTSRYGAQSDPRSAVSSASPALLSVCLPTPFQSSVSESMDYSAHLPRTNSTGSAGGSSLFNSPLHRRLAASTDDIGFRRNPASPKTPPPPPLPPNNSNGPTIATASTPVRSSSCSSMAVGSGESSPPPSTRPDTFETFVRGKFIVHELHFYSASDSGRMPPSTDIETIPSSQLVGLASCCELLHKHIPDSTHLSPATYEEYLRTQETASSFGNTTVVAAAAVSGSISNGALTIEMAQFTRFKNNERSPQFFYLFSHTGWGIRTMVANFCRERRLNFLSVGKTGLYNGSHTQGFYTALLDRAVRMQPCVLLIDRIGDEQWAPGGFIRAGGELFDQWVVHKYNTCMPPVRVWVVIAGVSPIQHCDQSFQNQIAENWSYVKDFLNEDQIYAIVYRVYANFLVGFGAADDRPAPSQHGSAESYRLALEASQFYRLLSSQEQLLRSLAQFIGHLPDQLRQSHQTRGTTDAAAVAAAAGFHIIPSHVATLVKHAFTLSSKRLSEMIYRHTIDTRNIPVEQIMPHREDFREATCCTYPFVRDLSFTV